MKKELDTREVTMGLVPSPKILVIRFNNGSGRFSSIISFSPHYRISNGDL